MTNPRWHLLLVLLAASLVAISGCSSDRPTSPASSPVEGDDLGAVDFDAAFGGLTTGDEPIAFDDPYLLAADDLVQGEAYADEWADDPQVRAMLRAGEGPGGPADPERPRFTFLRILWGKLDSDASDPASQDFADEIDWSGRLRVDRGIVLVRRVISFERPDDHIIRPRPDRHTVAWHSQAGRDFDGVLIQIIEPPLPPARPGQRGEDDPPPPNRLHIATGPFTQSFLVDDLGDLDAVFEVEAPGQAIHICGFVLGSIDPCPKGFLAGRWLSNPDDDGVGGYFHGRWIGIDGRVMGHLRGAWGLNAEGERVFFGKYIGLQGECLGRLAGIWAPGLRPGHGWFRGRWFDLDDNVAGVLDGNYLHHPELPGGSFQGRWSAVCDEEASGQIDDRS